MPRLLRDSPLNSIWEGSGNVIALDVLRAFQKEQGSFGALIQEAELAKGLDPRFDAALGEAEETAGHLAALPDEASYLARRLVERLALLLQGSLVLRHSPPFVAEAFLASRLARDGGSAFGTLPAGVDCAAIIDRHRPRFASA